MHLNRQQFDRTTKRFGIVFAVMICLVVGREARAGFTPGQTYDKSNAQELTDILPESIMRWLTEDQYIMKTGEIKDWVHDPKLLALSKENEGKFDIDQDGNLVYKKEGKPPVFFMGMPFPTIDTNDPQAGTKIIQNMFSSRYYYEGSGGSCGILYWLGKNGGPERTVVSGVVNLFYWNRRQGQIPNPNGFVSQRLNYVTEPMEVKGTTMMAWSYWNAREDAAFAYVPAIRRVRRTSAASRSDPFLGGEGTVDDVSGFDGKPSSMKWRLLGEKKILAPVVTTATVTYPVHADGSYTKIFDTPVVLGFMDKNFKGPSYAPLSLVWVPRQVYIVEMLPKDRYYNYSKEVIYVDKQNGLILLKDMYDRAGEFWKNGMNPNKKTVLSTGERVMAMPSMDMYLDWRARHAMVIVVGQGSGAITQDGNLPLGKVGPKFFTEANMKQISK
ncbi:MAG: DUF1329 domain-containing protein [Desulfatitalea sp.]|nr:DUF1329 domain-containing protein [Desulfatitalea sp.]NNJ99069.1 DUF1329 domain-containing protein [Desulfatitalea sp.]